MEIKPISAKKVAYPVVAAVVAATALAACQQQQRQGGVLHIDLPPVTPAKK